MRKASYTTYLFLLRTDPTRRSLLYETTKQFFSTARARQERIRQYGANATARDNTTQHTATKIAQAAVRSYTQPKIGRAPPSATSLAHRTPKPDLFSRETQPHGAAVYASGRAGVRLSLGMMVTIRARGDVGCDAGWGCAGPPASALTRAPQPQSHAPRHLGRLARLAWRRTSCGLTGSVRRHGHRSTKLAFAKERGRRKACE
eukprot:6202124-Pleurochrysis_carterae.AAC.1